MCEPATLALIATAASTLTAAVGQVGAYQSGKAQVKSINQQNELQSEQIAKAAGAESTERARAARREIASMRAAGSAAGLNIDTSGSFLAALQTASINQHNDQGLISYNERGQQKARQAEARSRMSQIQLPTALSAALTIGSTAIGSWQANKPAPTKVAQPTPTMALNYAPGTRGNA